jgi:AraC family transcriptional regulator of adaptative response / DNA-3-methyladenine glycosylase II
MLPQTLDPAACWAAVRSRDARFDGRFFFGVTSTGIYCRPVCSARTPRRDNCRFYPAAAVAERDGFRPCLRCRPELAPGLASVDATVRLAQAAAEAVEAGALLEGGLRGLADRLGVTDRHLRRVFRAQFGVSPVGWVQTQRLLLAKRLLTDTPLPVTEIALAAGFRSLRRFNDAFATRYRLAPGAMRRAARAGATAGDVDAGLRFRLAYRPPLDWPALAGFLARRAIEGVESVVWPRRRGVRADPVYRRVIRVPAPGGGERLGWIEVARAVARGATVHALEVRMDAALVGAIPAVLSRVRRGFDLGCRPDEVAAALGDLAVGSPGLRLAGAFDGLEIAVRAVLGQQVTVRQAHRLAARVATAFGEPVATPFDGVHHAFPSAARLAEAAPAAIAALGVTRRRADCVVTLARMLAGGELRLEPGADVQATVERLRAVPGVGDWTAQYLAMRALGWPDAFPAGDVGVMRALGVRTARQAELASQRWRPWRAYAVIHLWHQLASFAEPERR